MRVVRFYAPQDVRVEDAPSPRPGPASWSSGSATARSAAPTPRSGAGHPDLRPPRVLGHEVAGEVVEVGEGAGGWAPGDRVQVIAAVPDGSCHECRHGWASVCPNQERIGYHHDGGFAELLRVPAKVLAVDGVNHVPDGLSFAEASVAEPLSCVVNGQELAGVGEGQTVVVVGAGPIGCLHVRLAGPGRGQGAPGRAEPAAAGLGRRPGRARRGRRGQRRRPGGGGPRADRRPRRRRRHRRRRLRQGPGGRPAMAARRGTVSFFGGLPRTGPPSPATPTSSTTARWASSAPTAPAPPTTSRPWS